MPSGQEPQLYYLFKDHFADFNDVHWKACVKILQFGSCKICYDRTSRWVHLHKTQHHCGNVAHHYGNVVLVGTNHDADATAQ